MCAHGACSSACSRVLLPLFASDAECNAFREAVQAVMPPADEYPHTNLYLSSASAVGEIRTTLSFIRLLERMRRAISYEYGLELSSIAPKQAFVSRIMGFGADMSRQSLHADESSIASYHYSDPYPGGGRVEHPISPHKGLALIFSSGWENPHFVKPVLSGCRFAVPAFFETRSPASPSPDPPLKEGEEAEALWRMGLMPQTIEDCNQLLCHWHRIFAGDA
ncbi:MAG: hypothetical protein SGPRY_014858 [Prymnesium sp.]